MYNILHTFQKPSFFPKKIKKMGLVLDIGHFYSNLIFSFSSPHTSSYQLSELIHPWVEEFQDYTPKDRY